MIVSPKREVSNAWEDIELSEATFKLASQISKILTELKIARGSIFKQMGIGDYCLAIDLSSMFIFMTETKLNRGVSQLSCQKHQALIPTNPCQKPIEQS